MIEITCSCGRNFEVLNEEVAKRMRCPRCGALAADLIAAAEQGGGVEESQPTEASAPQFQVFCVNHPDQYATQNCMNCAKPLCMICVRERGYYCSDECRATVSASEPSAVTDSEAGSLDDTRIQRVMGAIVSVTKLLLLVGIIGGAGYLGYNIYLSKWGPRPQITSSVDTIAGSFRTVVLDPTRVLVQADDELSLVNLTTKEKLWKVDLHALEEPYTAAKRASSDSDFSFDASKFRDPLSLAEVKGDNIVLNSERQLVTVNAQSGDVKWKFFEPAGYLSHVTVTDEGVFGIVSGDYTATGRPHSRAACWALDDGTQRWSDTNGQQYAAAMVTPDSRLMTLREESPKPAAAGESQSDITASGLDVNAFKSTMYKKIQTAMAKGDMNIDSAAEDEDTPPGPTRNYVLQFYAVATGASLGQSTVALAGVPRVEPLAKLVCVVAGREVLAFRDNTEPAWRVTLPAAPQLLAEGGDVVAIATKDRVLALDANSGTQRWIRDKVNPQRLFVGPDGGVYAMISIPRPEFDQSEAKKFRIEDISIGGTTDPRLPVTALVRLDPKSGKTAWGVRNIGRELVFAPDAVFVFDSTTELRLLSDTGLNVSYHSIHCVSPKSGRELWTYLKTGEMHDHTIKDGKGILVTTEGTALGTPAHPSYTYRLCMVERK